MVTISAASAIRAGAVAAQKVYLGTSEVWSATPAAPTPGTTFWYSFDGGAPGTNLTTSDAGSGTPFSALSSPLMSYATPGKNAGGLCGQIPTGATITSFAQWDGPASSQLALGMWVKVAALPTGDTRVMDIRDTPAAGTVGGVLLRSDGTLRLLVGTAGFPAATSAALTTGVWYWVSLGWDAAAKTARLTIHTAAGASFYDSGIQSISSTYTAPQTARFGRVTTDGDVGACQFDDLQYNQGSADVLPPWGI